MYMNVVLPINSSHWWWSSKRDPSALGGVNLDEVMQTLPAPGGGFLLNTELQMMLSLGGVAADAHDHGL